ncbi:hypothetical protein, partial [Enterobacter hormaechei]
STSKAIRHRKNNTLRLLPGGAALSPAYRYLCRVIAPPPRNTKLKTNTKTPPGTVSYKKIRSHEKKKMIWFFVFWL